MNDIALLVIVRLNCMFPVLLIEHHNPYNIKRHLPLPFFCVIFAIVTLIFIRLLLQVFLFVHQV